MRCSLGAAEPETRTAARRDVGQAASARAQLAPFTPVFLWRPTCRPRTRSDALETADGDWR